MTPKQVHELVINKTHEYVKDFDFTGLQAAVFDEVCEKIATSNTHEKLTGDGIILAAITAFQASHEIIKSTIRLLLTAEDTVSLYYRDQAFQFNKDSVL